MRKIIRLFYIQLIIISQSCFTVDQGPERQEYIGKYELIFPTDFKDNLDPLRHVPYVSSMDLESSYEYQNMNTNDLKDAYIEIKEDSTFYIKNKLFKDSVGSWRTHFDFEHGGYLDLKFKNLPLIVRFNYEEKGYRVLPFSKILILDTDSTNKLGETLVFVYKKK